LDSNVATPEGLLAYGGGWTAAGGRIMAMLPPLPTVVAVSSNRGAAYDLVLLAHVLAALVGFGTVAVAGIFALILVRRGPVSESVRRYYRPGVNWAGRILFLVPVLGIVLVVMSRGAWSFADAWIGIGLVLWAGTAMAAEMVLWPAERQLQALVAAGSFDGTEHRALGHRVTAVAAAMMVVLVVAAVVMVAKP
jgi:Predicted integral membrane protein (DUF2269)